MPLHDGLEDLTRLVATAPHRSMGYYPVKVRHHSESLSVDVSRVVAYRTSCACGWKSHARSTVKAARHDYDVHAAEHHV